MADYLLIFMSNLYADYLILVKFRSGYETTENRYFIFHLCGAFLIVVRKFYEHFFVCFTVV